MAEQAQGVRIEIDKEKAGGEYSNFALIHHTDNEFILDFVFLQPQAPVGKIQSRIIISPVHAKEILAALKTNINNYEKKFGRIKKRKLKQPKITQAEMDSLLKTDKSAG